MRMSPPGPQSMAKPNKAPAAPTPLRVEDRPWGCVFTGTRIQIIAAGIVPLDQCPVFGKNHSTFQGRWLMGGRAEPLGDVLAR